MTVTFSTASQMDPAIKASLLTSFSTEVERLSPEEKTKLNKNIERLASFIARNTRNNEINEMTHTYIWFDSHGDISRCVLQNSGKSYQMAKQGLSEPVKLSEADMKIEVKYPNVGVRAKSKAEGTSESLLSRAILCQFLTQDNGMEALEMRPVDKVAEAAKKVLSGAS